MVLGQTSHYHTKGLIEMNWSKEHFTLQLKHDQKHHDQFSFIVVIVSASPGRGKVGSAREMAACLIPGLEVNCTDWLTCATPGAAAAAGQPSFRVRTTETASAALFIWPRLDSSVPFVCDAIAHVRAVLEIGQPG